MMAGEAKQIIRSSIARGNSQEFICSARSSFMLIRFSLHCDEQRACLRHRIIAHLPRMELNGIRFPDE